MVSEMLPHLGELVDDFAFVHTLTSKTNTHGPGENFLSTGFVQDGFPSIGAWVTWALGTENQNLPAFVAIPDPRGIPQASVNNWGPGFLPAVFQGTPFSSSQLPTTQPAICCGSSTNSISSKTHSTRNWPPVLPAMNWQPECSRPYHRLLISAQNHPTPSACMVLMTQQIPFGPVTHATAFLLAD
jgi:hypothetical protein